MPTNITKCVFFLNGTEIIRSTTTTHMETINYINIMDYIYESIVTSVSVSMSGFKMGHAWKACLSWGSTFTDFFFQLKIYQKATILAPLDF